MRIRIRIKIKIRIRIRIRIRMRIRIRIRKRIIQRAKRSSTLYLTINWLSTPCQDP